LHSSQTPGIQFSQLQIASDLFKLSEPMTHQSPQNPQKQIRTISRKWILLLGLFSLIVGALSLLFFDQLMTQLVTTKKHVSFYTPVRFLTELGEGKYYFAFVIVAGLFSWLGVQYFKRAKNTNHDFLFKVSTWSGFALLCMLSSGIILQLCKHIIGRQRPHVSAEVDPHIFDFFTSKWHYHSMPSGHAQTVFTFATILWITFPKLTKWIFVVPILLALTRLPLEEHFFSDVFIGAYLGFCVTVLVSYRLNRVHLKA